ncbi:MAG: hypothetical protein KGN97_02890 [Bacteroidota bacterium]|jgi:hypothetical protein|nr:hypothetical protein [Bacteroidota bacterium]
MKKYTYLVAFLLVAVFLTSTANAQYTVREYFASVARSNEPFRPLQRIELGYGFYNMNTANFQFDYNKTDINNQLIDTYYVATMKPTAAMSASFGLHFPIAMLRNRGVVAVATTFAYNKMDYETDKFYLTTSNYLTYKFATTQMAARLGVDLMVGNHGVLDKSKPTCYTIGLGLAPTQFNMTPSVIGTDGKSTNGDAVSKMKMQPYIKAEIGFMAGLCFKLRATYSFGRADLMRVTTPSAVPASYPLATTFQMRSNLELSFIIMPLSPAWRKSRWY